jgi:hypothetical protein
MPSYRFFFLKADGLPARASAFTFPDDGKATDFAKLASGGQPAELWDGERIVWRHPPATSQDGAN